MCDAMEGLYVDLCFFVVLRASCFVLQDVMMMCMHVKLVSSTTSSQLMLCLDS